MRRLMQTMVSSHLFGFLSAAGDIDFFLQGALLQSPDYFIVRLPRTPLCNRETDSVCSS